MKNYLSSKKGQLTPLAPMILALVFAAVVLVFGLVMSQELRDTQDGVGVSINTNEAATLVNAGDALARYTECGFNSPVISSVQNATWVILEGGNYSVNGTGFLFNITNEHFGPVTVNYSYQWGGEACDAANNTIVGLGTFADFWEIIVLAIVITIVIGLLLVVFGGRRAR